MHLWINKYWVSTICLHHDNGFSPLLHFVSQCQNSSGSVLFQWFQVSVYKTDYKIMPSFKRADFRTSLVVQWLKICLPMPGCVCSQLLSHVWLCDPMDCSTARLLCPWDFPGKNTGVGCHFLLQGIFPTRDWTRVSYVSCIANSLPQGSQCRGQEFNPWSSKIPHALGQLSRCPITADPALQSLCSAAREATATRSLKLEEALMW